MQPNEWYYSELLDLLKRKKTEEPYKQIELELPSPEPTSQIDESTSRKKSMDRGVVVIDC